MNRPPRPDVSPTIRAHRLEGQTRLNCLPRHFGRMFFAVENTVYDMLRTLSPDYDGGLWEFYELDNGGFYMAPTAPATLWLACPGNGYEGSMSADAAGLVASSMALSHLSFSNHAEAIIEHFYFLQDFIAEHKERRDISAALD